MSMIGAWGGARDARIAVQANAGVAGVKARSAGRSHNHSIIESRLQGYFS